MPQINLIRIARIFVAMSLVALLLGVMRVRGVAG
jgi:hypothetical protein